MFVSSERGRSLLDVLPYTERTGGNCRDLRQVGIMFGTSKGRRRFLRISINGIHRQTVGFHWSHYRRHCWHLSCDWRTFKGRRGITLSYGLVTC